MMNKNSTLSPLKNSASVERPRILIVDDMPENLAILLDALKDDFAVVAARTGSKALQLAMTLPAPDLVLLDIVMPEMDGYQVCSRLKEMDETCDIPVIFLTSLEEKESETHGLALGAVDFIRKPIHPITLRLRVKLHLELFQARRRLEEQNRQLVESARLREDIEHIMRHDLKSPLDAIISLPELLLGECEFTDSQRKYVKMIIESGYNMLEMINRALDLLKIERGTYEFCPEPVDILSVMRRVLTEVSSRTTGKNLQVNLRLDSQPPRDGQTVMAMAETLFCYSMFSNLVKNAVEASPRNDVINIGFDSGGQVTISIENGGEVPVGIRKHFFDKFVTSGKSCGTGLGTYSARLIALTQKGTIDLDTTVAGRTCVRVTIPAVGEGQDELTQASDFIVSSDDHRCR